MPSTVASHPSFLAMLASFTRARLANNKMYLADKNVPNICSVYYFSNKIIFLSIIFYIVSDINLQIQYILGSPKRVTIIFRMNCIPVWLGIRTSGIRLDIPNTLVNEDYTNLNLLEN